MISDAKEADEKAKPNHPTHASLRAVVRPASSSAARLASVGWFGMVFLMTSCAIYRRADYLR